MQRLDLFLKQLDTCRVLIRVKSPLATLRTSSLIRVIIVFVSCQLPGHRAHRKAPGLPGWPTGRNDIFILLASISIGAECL